MKPKHVSGRSMSTILLLGSGALKIGEAGEFDYSGSQAIKALKEAGRRVVLVNPNIATVQTSEGRADTVYFLPVDPFFVERVIEREKPDGILLSFGGQTALNCGLELEKQGVFKKHHIHVLGTPISAIETTEDRKLFAQHLLKLHLKTARGKTVHSIKEANAFAKSLGFPVMLRTGFALGGTGSGVAYSQKELDELLEHTFATSRQSVVEESLYGWKEIEYEVVRDIDDNCVTVCNMENMDPVGVHTGESIVVAPSQTLNDKEYYRFRQMSIDVIRSLQIVGECNIQYAIHPTSGDYRIIEVNARLSRSSALASKATGYPLANIAVKLALGQTLPELRNRMTGKTSAFFEPALDYCVVKIPRWDLDKFTGVDQEIGSEMKSVGEVMALGRNFEETVQKAARMLNDGYAGVIDAKYLGKSKATLLKKLNTITTMRLFTICSALYAGVPESEIVKRTAIDTWFISKLAQIVSTFRRLQKTPKLVPDILLQAKRDGFSDAQIAGCIGKNDAYVRAKRLAWHIWPVVKRIDTMAGEFPVVTNYLYCTYHGSQSDHVGAKEKKVIVLGCGPYSIGTSVEFDWCAVYTAKTIRDRGQKAIMINCNPETVSTDYDESDYLYFEELTLERVLDIYDIEHAPMVVSVGGQIPNNLAPKLACAHIPILGTSTENIYRAEHRKSFNKLLDRLGVLQPPWTEVSFFAQVKKEAKRIGYPILVRPSFVLSGKGMQVVVDEKMFRTYIASLPFSIEEYPLVMSKFLSGAKECDLDGVAAHGEVILFALSEHVEMGGTHSGDASLMLPSQTLPPLVQAEIIETGRKIAGALSIHGPFNIQFLINEEDVYVIECNVRASRSFPFVSKAYDINFIEVATAVMLGKSVLPMPQRPIPYSVVKVPQFSFKKLRGADPLLHVEMASTGEVSAFAPDVWAAFLTATIAAGVSYPSKKTAFVSLGGLKGKLEFLKGAHLLNLMGYILYATNGTSIFLRENSIPARSVRKIYEGDSGGTVLDLMQEKKIDFAVVTTEASRGIVTKSARKQLSDGYVMRRMSVDMGIPIFTNAETAKFFIEGLRRYSPFRLPIVPWQAYTKVFKQKEAV